MLILFADPAKPPTGRVQSLADGGTRSGARDSPRLDVNASPPQFLARSDLPCPLFHQSKIVIPRSRGIIEGRKNRSTATGFGPALQSGDGKAVAEYGKAWRRRATRRMGISQESARQAPSARSTRHAAARRELAEKIAAAERVDPGNARQGTGQRRASCHRRRRRRRHPAHQHHRDESGAARASPGRKDTDHVRTSGSLGCRHLRPLRGAADNLKVPAKVAAMLDERSAGHRQGAGASQEAARGSAGASRRIQE